MTLNIPSTRNAISIPVDFQHFYLEPVVKQIVGTKSMSHPKKHDTKAANQRTRLLLVDNDVTLRHSLGLMFSEAGFEVLHAPDGRKALEIYQRNPAHIVVAEMILPEMDGVELLVNLRKRKPRPKFIAVTAGGRMDASFFLRAATHLGANRTLAKPFCPVDLLKQVNELTALPE